MKKLLVFIICFYWFGGYAQLRKVRADEIAFYNTMHAAMYGSLPHPYKDWTEVGDGEKFDVLDFFCNGAFDMDKCRGNVGVRLGLKDPYALNYFVDYTIPDNDKQSLAGEAMGMIKDYNNAGQIAASLKLMRKTKLQIHILANVNVEGANAAVLVYCSKTPIVNLTIPVPTTLAILGERSAACPVITDGRANMSPGGDAYLDDAVVFLGKAVTTKMARPDGDGLIRVDYGIGFNRTQIGTLKVQNILVQFKGDAKDIKAAVALMDWQKLYTLIGK